MNIALPKQKPLRFPSLMEWAQGHDAGCQLRYPGWCRWTPTCGSHIPSGPRFGKGTAHKPHDLIALGCDPCHKIADGHIKTDFSAEYVRLVWLEGFYATVVIAIEEGLIQIAGAK